MAKQEQWELPKHQWYRVRERGGSEGKQIREGTVTCQCGNRILVIWDDKWPTCKRSSLNMWIRIASPDTVAASGAEIVYQ